MRLTTLLSAAPVLLLMMALMFHSQSMLLAQLTHVAVGMFLFLALEDMAEVFDLIPATLAVAIAGVLHALYVGALVGVAGFIAGTITVVMVLGIGMWRMSVNGPRELA